MQLKLVPTNSPTIPINQHPSLSHVPKLNKSIFSRLFYSLRSVPTEKPLLCRDTTLKSNPNFSPNSKLPATPIPSTSSLTAKHKVKILRIHKFFNLKALPRFGFATSFPGDYPGLELRTATLLVSQLPTVWCTLAANPCTQV